MAGGKASRQKGDRFERACILRLRDAGWHAVRSAGSLGPADIWAARSDRGLIWVQCKFTDNTTVANRSALHAQAADAGALVVIASRNDTLTVWQYVDAYGHRTDFELR